MSKTSDEVVIEGWLTKSPPTKRIWRARWRRRWFSLRHSGELPGQFLLTYYTDRNCRKMKGAINLDRCEQVDLGLKLEEKKLKFDHVFDIKTPTRTYYLAADTEIEMKSWVTCISRVCDLKCTSGDEDLRIQQVGDNSDVEIVEEHEEKPPIEDGSDSPPLSPVSTGPYIPISECFTGRSPILGSQDFQALLDHNIRSSYFRSSGSYKQNLTNDAYELAHRTYLNWREEFGRSFYYDQPRNLSSQNSAAAAAANTGKEDAEHVEKDDKASPLQSPTDSESVFTDDDWAHNTSGDLNTSRHTKPSDSSADVDVTVLQKYTKSNLENADTTTVAPPPRPPKPSQPMASHNYFNLMPAPAARNKTTVSTEKNAASHDSKDETNLNCKEESGGIFYEQPRKLTPQNSAVAATNTGKEDGEHVEKDDKESPLQSPTDSESVFTDDDWAHNTSGDLNTSRHTKPSDSSADVDVTVAQKFTKMSLENADTTTVAPPPRPPKPPQLITGHNYFNLMPAPTARNKTTSICAEENAAGSDTKIITDDMYDFPRSHHQVETESARNTLGRRHCYNNAEPANVEGHVFRYDDSPKPRTSATMFKYDTDDVQQQQDEPVSPALSQSSAYVLYSNLNSPVLSMPLPPPAVNRDLKPRRKLSDSHSISSNPEPSSPRSLAAAPTIDRKLKPPMQRPEDDVVRRQRAAPSPTPPGQGRSLECLMDPGDQEQIYHYLPGSKKIQYLDLDLDLGGSLASPSDKARSSEANTVYKEVDFTKTMAFNLTRNNLEKERNKEPIGYFKK